MKRFILFILVSLLLISVSVWAADMGATHNKNTPTSTYVTSIMKNFSSTGNGTGGIGESYNIGFVSKSHQWVLDIKGTPSAAKVLLKGSLDDSNWYTMDTYSTITPPGAFSRSVQNIGAYFVRAELITFTNGTTVSIESVHSGN